MQIWPQYFLLQQTFPPWRPRGECLENLDKLYHFGNGLDLSVFRVTILQIDTNHFENYKKDFDIVNLENRTDPNWHQLYISA